MFISRKPITFVLQKRSNTATEFALGIKTRNGYGYQERPVCEGIAEQATPTNRKIVIVDGSTKVWTDENGIVYVGVIPFLLEDAGLGF